MMKLIFIIALGLFSTSPALAFDKKDLAKEGLSFLMEEFELKNMLIGQWYESKKTCDTYVSTLHYDDDGKLTATEAFPKDDELQEDIEKGGSKDGTSTSTEITDGKKSVVEAKYPASYEFTCEEIPINSVKLELKTRDPIESCRIENFSTTNSSTTTENENFLDAMIKIYNQGTSDCYCCSNPSMCLAGNFSVLTAAFRHAGMLGAFATFADKSIQKHCDAIKKVQNFAGSMDAFAATKCGKKSRQCHKQFKACSEKIQEIIDKTNTISNTTLPNKISELSDKISELSELIELTKRSPMTMEGKENQLNDFKKKLNDSKEDRGNITKALNDCETGRLAMEEFKNTWNEAIEQKCGAIKSAKRKQWIQSAASFASAQVMDKCAGDYKDDQQIAVAPCNNQSLSNNPQACQAHCLTSPEDPQCVNFCKQYPGDRVCQGVCSNQSPGHNYAFCTVVQNCVTNPDGENCDQISVRETASYDEGERTTLNLNSLDNAPRAGSECDDPLECDLDLDGFVEDPKEKAKSTGSMQYGGGGGGSAGGGGGGGLGGGGTGGGVAQGAEDAEVDGQNEEYKNILAGLSPKDNSGSRSGRSFSYRGSSSNSDKDRGFDLSKFLPKDKKKKAASVRRSRKIAGPEDNIFTALSSTVRVYCGDNQLQCN